VRPGPLFADAFYWIALLNPDDDHHDRVKHLASQFQRRRIVTTEEVLVEVLASFSAQSAVRRRAVVVSVRKIMANRNIEVEPQSHDSFLAGLALYDDRPDKGYSLVDCISMNTMRARGIYEALTRDEHFEQEGFVRLIRE
jgi:predicted nucleic acid-binding protein